MGSSSLSTNVSDTETRPRHSISGLETGLGLEYYNTGGSHLGSSESMDTKRETAGVSWFSVIGSFLFPIIISFKKAGGQTLANQIQSNRLCSQDYIAYNIKVDQCHCVLNSSLDLKC